MGLFKKTKATAAVESPGKKPGEPTEQKNKPEINKTIPRQTARYRYRNGRNYGSILSSEQKKKIVKEKRKEAKKRIKSTQNTLPFETMYDDGVCKVNDHFYTKMMAFSDINYQLSDGDDRDNLFNGWCNFYDFFDPDVKVQICCVVQRADIAVQEKTIEIQKQDDGFNDVRDEYNQMLREQLLNGNNGYIRMKYVVYGVEGQNMRQIHARLEQIETEIANTLGTIRVKTHILSGYERLRLLRGLLNPEDHTQFDFNYDLITRTGLSAKDFISPMSMYFGDGYYFKLGKNVGRASFFQILSDKLDDSLMSRILSTDCNMIVSIHVQSIDQEAAVKLIKRALTDVDKSKIDEQKNAVRTGYDMDILPPDLVTYGKSFEQTLEQVQSGEDRFFITTVLITNVEQSKQKLDAAVNEITSLSRQQSCAIKVLDWRQEKGFIGCLPLDVLDDNLKCSTTLTTRAVAGLVPFTTVELFQRTGSQLYAGVNALSNNIIMLDRKTLDNPNGLILGVPGSGKSFSSKEEIINTFISTNDDIIICDPESEYGPLVSALHGQIVMISPTSHDYINPMDINTNYSDGEAAAKLKIDFILSLMELIIGGKNGLEPIEMSIIDVAAENVYEQYFDDPDPEKMPILEDLYSEILNMKRPEAERVATKLERFVHGSSNLFNHRTNVDIKNRIVCFDIKSLGAQLKKIGMMTVQDHVWNRVTANRMTGKFTRYYMDEFHLLLADPQTAAYTVEIYKRFRKFGGIPTGITQNITDLLSSTQIANIFSNCEYIRMLKQKGDDARLLQKELHISPKEMKYVTNMPPGNGLLFFGSVIIPFKDPFPKNTNIYRIITTKPAEQITAKA